MELEDCTKEELIWLLQNRCVYRFHDFEFDILMRRGEKINKAAHAEFARANDALGEYIDIIKPYDGQPLKAIPDAVIHKATEKLTMRESALKKYERLEKEYRAIQRRTDQILGIKEGRQNG